MEPTIGEQLRKRRQKKDLSLQQVSEATHIRTQFLQALEDDRFSDLPSNIQTRGFIRLYASHLGLDSHALLLSLDALTAAAEVIESNEIIPIEKKAAFKFTLRKKNKEIEPIHETAPEPKPVVPLQTYKGIGKELSQRRESLGLSLEDVENHTHIKKGYLDLLEQGRFDELSSPMQARGLLSNYTEFLNLDANKILDRFAEVLQSKHADQHGVKVKKEEKIEPIKKTWFASIRQFLTTDLIVGFVLIVTVFTFIIWGASQIMTARMVLASPSAPAIANVIDSTNTPTPQETVTVVTTGTETTPLAPGTSGQEEASPSPQATNTRIAASSAALQVNITANQRAFLRVVADGSQVYNDRVFPGNAYQFTASNRIELITGNAAALDIVFNQNDLGALGNTGQQVWLIFSREGVQTPTSQFTPTSTRTQPPTLTPHLSTTTPTPTVTLLVPNP